MLFLYAIICGVVSAGLAYLLNTWALRKWRRSAGEHWTERARLLYPARIGAFHNLMFLPLIAGLISVFVFDISLMGNLLLCLLIWICIVLATYPMDREVFPWLKFEPWIKEVVGSWTLLITWMGIYFVAGTLMPSEVGLQMWAAFALFLVLLVLLNTRGLLPILKAMGIIQRASPSLFALVERVSSRMNVPVNCVWQWKSSAANALAFPTTGELLFSTRLLESMTEEEVEAICAHELGHLDEGRGILWLRILGSLSAAPMVLIKPAVTTFGFLSVIALILVWITLSRCVNWMSRKLELQADAAAVNETDKMTYALALARLHELNHMPAVMPRKNLTHPDLYDRLLAAGVTPDFPRPQKPRGTSMGGRVITFVFMICLFLLISKGINR